MCEHTLTELSFYLKDVFVSLRMLNVKKARGSDGILSRLLKETTHQIAPSLCTLLNRSLDSGILPDEWKLANIIPVLKKGEKSHAETIVLNPSFAAF